MCAKGRQEITGRIQVHPKGYAFVTPSDGSGEADIYVPRSGVGSAVHGDEVLVRLRPRRGRRRPGRDRHEGVVVEVVSRERTSIVGKLLKYRDAVFLAPSDPRYPQAVRLQPEGTETVEHGRIVAARVISESRPGEPLLAELEAELGDASNSETQYQITCHLHQIPMEFPEEALEEAAGVEAPDESSWGERVDLRDKIVFTIDGETARDFDDAVSLEILENGNFLLGVHIADVSHYVPYGSALDQEALLRGTSVYFPDRAIPMLPDRLSGDVCSLRPERSRLTLTAEIEMDRDGAAVRSRFYPSVIRSCARLTYTEVGGLWSRSDAEAWPRGADLQQTLEDMRHLSRILRRGRRRSGAIDFDLPEAEIRFGSDGEVVDIVRSERNEAHRLIEEFMLAANQAVAGYLQSRDVPLMYRIHEEPDPEKVEIFQEIALKFGHRLHTGRDGKIGPGDFQKLIDRLQGTKEERFLSYLMLRSFQQARYTPENRGHFGLAMAAYTHFTSPIRRYPDLVVHRILRAALNDGLRQKWVQETLESLPEVGERSSIRERQAESAEREILRWLMARFMTERLGDEFEGFIVDMKDNGFYVELIDHYVEGFVPVQAIRDDYYVFNEKGHLLIGENTRRTFRIGDSVRVRVDKVDPDRHLIDFSVAD